ncbi:hypothetical protein BSKO_09094 [Bryopsis sp. KO-2023]|nr:hypothetical protein BSKO_09094 [Bryopsis sp. KO-2023]
MSRKVYFAVGSTPALRFSQTQQVDCWIVALLSSAPRISSTKGSLNHCGEAFFFGHYWSVRQLMIQEQPKGCRGSEATV